MKEYDRLVEISPDIPNEIIHRFKLLYKDSIDLIKQKSILLRPNSNVKIHQKRVKKVDFEYGQLNM